MAHALPCLGPQLGPFTFIRFMGRCCSRFTSRDGATSRTLFGPRTERACFVTVGVHQVVETCCMSIFRAIRNSFGKTLEVQG